MERKKGLEFVRAISAIGIIAFHFYCHSNSNYKLFLDHANGSWGHTLNFLFFALSGYLLCLRYGWKEPLNVRKFYYKRWKSTMPAYLIVFSYVFLTNVFSSGRFFYLDIPKSRLFLTLIGLDGYVHWVRPTYFATGEWFLGAILVAYASYPVLRFLQNRAKYLTLTGLLLVCLCVYRLDFWGLPYYVNPFVCLFTFYIGMLLAEHAEQIENRIIATMTLMVALLLVCVRCVFWGYSTGENALAIKTMLEVMAGISFLITLNYWGERLCAGKAIYQSVQYISDLSYYIFLIHHSIIYKVLGGFNPFSTKRSLLVLGAITIIILLLAKVLQIVMKAVFNSYVFVKFEKFITKG